MNEFSDPTPPPLPARARNAPGSGGSGWGRGCLIAVMGGLLGALSLVVLVTLLLGGLAASFGSFSREAAPDPSRGEDEFPRLREAWSSGRGDRKVVRIPLRGTIVLEEGSGGWIRGGAESASAALRAIRRATADPEIRGILLEVDSGGGGITASDILYDALMRFRKADPERKVVAHMGNLAASGAYYVALAADRILAHPTTITGSIGVLLTSFNARELADRLGIRDVTIKSGANKDLLNPLGELSVEQRLLLQAVVDQMHVRFTGLVEERRGLSPREVQDLADGRIFLAAQALELGLVDGLGYTAEAEAEIAGLLGESSVRVVRYEQPVSLRDLLRSPGFWGAAFSEALPEASSPSALTLQ